MVAIALLDADICLPVIGFPKDADPLPFEHLGLLHGKTNWLADQDRHLEMEIVDSEERRWIVVDIVQLKAEPRRWWQLRRPADPPPEVELEEIEPQAFAITRARVEAVALELFETGDEALTAISAASDMAALSAACFEITVRGQGRRVLAGVPDIAIRPPEAVARRALILFAIVRLSLGADRLSILQWLDKQDLNVALSPDEVDLLGKFRSSEQELAAAMWNIEQLVAILWALGLMDWPASIDAVDASVIADVVPPTAEQGVAAFVGNASLRSPIELAAVAERHHILAREAASRYAAEQNDQNANEASAMRRRSGALQWILNPDRLDWE